MAARDALKNFHRFVQGHEGHATESHYTEDELERYVSRMDKSVHSLQNQIKNLEASIREVNPSGSTIPGEADGDVLRFHRPSPSALSAEHRRARLHRLQATKTAYKSMTLQEPPLPSAESPLPALLAIQCTSRTIHQAKQTIQKGHRRLLEAHAQMRSSVSSHNDTEYFRRGLQERSNRLQGQETEQCENEQSQIVLELVLEQQQRSSLFQNSLRGLVKALNAFVNDHLAIMLAAEDLSGPIVGDDLDLDEESLEAGFTPQGKPKKRGSHSSDSEKKRLIRNTQIWGQEYARDRQGKPISETRAAGASFRDLTEDLLNASANMNEQERYIRLNKETAAVRFLVRANVAQFHPEDSNRIRLR